jgi:hypothetical protein
MKARDAIRKSDFAEIQKALELYHLQYGTYPYGQKEIGNHGQKETCASDWKDC